MKKVYLSGGLVTDWQEEVMNRVPDAVFYNPKEFEVEGLHRMPVGIYCSDEKTEILTKEGWKKFSDLNGSNLVATLEDGFLIFVNPIEIVKEYYEGSMYYLKSKFIDMKTTPNHRLYVKKKYKKDYELITAVNGFGIRKTFRKNADWLGEDTRVFILPEYTNEYGFHKENREIPMDAFIEFLGYYISEGWSGKWRTVITQSLESPFYDDMVDSVKRIGYTPSISGNRKNITINDVQLTNYLKMTFGKDSYSKRIPAEFKNLKKEFLFILLESLMKGDGAQSRPRYRTVSKQLADDFQEVAIKCGYACDVRWGESDEIYSLTLSSKFHEVADRHASKGLGVNSKESWIPYKGMVYSVVVPSGLILVRRNGVAYWTGNSPMDRIMIRRADIVFGYLEASNPTPINVVAECCYAKGLGKTVVLCDEWTGENIKAGNLKAVRYKDGKGNVWFKPHYLDLVRSWMDFVETDLGHAISILKRLVEE